MARPIASICCSPPDIVPAALRHTLAEAREQGADPGQTLVDDGGGRAAGADLKVFPHRHLGHDAPSLRDVGDAEAGDIVGRHAVEGVTLEHDRAGARGRGAEQGAQQRRFAGAVGAEQRHDLAFGDLKFDPV